MNDQNLQNSWIFSSVDNFQIYDNYLVISSLKIISDLETLIKFEAWNFHSHFCSRYSSIYWFNEHLWFLFMKAQCLLLGVSQILLPYMAWNGGSEYNWHPLSHHEHLLNQLQGLPNLVEIPCYLVYNCINWTFIVKKAPGWVGSGRG